MDLRGWTRRHVLGLTVVLSVGSLSLIFAAALRAIPTGLLPRAPETVMAAIPHVNAAIVALAAVVVAYGWWSIRHRRITRHRYAMGTGFTLFVAFLVLYLYRVMLHGPTAFEGTGLLASVYYVTLGIHITLAILCVPLVYYVLLLGLSTPIAELPRTNHPRIGRIAVSLWLISFVLGDVVYALLYLR